MSCIQLLVDDIDQLSRDGFHWIIQKVGKVRFSTFSHNYWYYSVVANCCPYLLHHVASLLWNQSCPKIWKVWNCSKCHFQSQNGPIWSFVIYFRNGTPYDESVYEIHIVSPICMTFQFNWWNLTFDDISRSMSFQLSVINKWSMLCLKCIRNT